MAVRSTMAQIIGRVRTMINDSPGASQTFDDQTIQDVLDDSRQDYVNEQLITKPTYTGGTIQYLNYWHPLGSWEGGVVLKQYLTVTVTPSANDFIAGYWTFATNTLPPVFLTGSTHDLYCAAADLLERWAAKLVLNYDFSSDGQSFKRSQAAMALQKLAKTYRSNQRANSLYTMRSDLQPEGTARLGLGANELDYMSSG
jgi:hypothetical protein